MVYCDVMTDAAFLATLRRHAGDLTIESQRKAGQPVTGVMSKEHEEFMLALIALIDAGEIDPYKSESFLHADVYQHLDDAWREKVDISLANIAHQIRLIEEFYRSKETPNACPQLETMVAQLMDMKSRIEIDKDHDVFKF